MCVSKRNWPPSSVCRVLIVCAYDHVTYRQLQLHLVSGDKSYCTLLAQEGKNSDIKYISC